MSKCKEDKKNKQENVNSSIEDENCENVAEAVEKVEIEENPLEKEVENLKTQLSEEKDRLMRTAAEYANYRSRTEKEKAQIYGNATADAIKTILPIADSIDSAIAAMKDAPEEYKKGVELIKSQMAKAFDGLGIESFGDVGDEFNPDLYNAISHIDDENFGENTVSMVFQKGYKCGEKIIRHCMVQVAN